MFVGKNPWQSHGFPRARTVLKAIAKDPDRAHDRDRPAPHRDRRPGRHPPPGPPRHRRLVPRPRCWRCWWRRTCSTTTFAGRARRRLRRAARTHLRAVDIPSPPAPWPACEESTGPGRGRDASPAPRSVSIFEDLGIQQAPHSTLNSYLEKLLYLLTGNFARPGGDEHPHPLRQPGRRRRTGGRPGPGHAGHRASHHHRPDAVQRHPRRDPHRPPGPLPGHDRRERQPGPLAARQPPHARGARRPRPRGGHRRRPDRDRPPRRLRAAGGVAVREVGGDVLQPRVPRQRASTSAAPVLDPLPGTLPEPEIHRRLVRALGALRRRRPRPAARGGGGGPGRLRRRVPDRSWRNDRTSARWRRWSCTRRSARRWARGTRPPPRLWGLAQTCALAYPGVGAAGRLRRRRRPCSTRSSPARRASPSPSTSTRRPGAASTPRRAGPPRGRRSCSRSCARCPPTARRRVDPEFPFVLSAGERRSSTANTIYRDPAWRKKDADGALRMNPDDAASLGVTDGRRVRVTHPAGQRRRGRRGHRLPADRPRHPAERARPVPARTPAPPPVPGWRPTS